jgi:hypothetical protein
MAPILAHANIATAASGTIGMYIETRSPFLTPRDFQCVTKSANFFVQLLIGELLVITGLIAFPNYGGLISPLTQMAIDTIYGDIELAVNEPV